MKPVQPNEYSSRLSCAERLNREKRTSFKRPTPDIVKKFFLFFFIFFDQLYTKNILIITSYKILYDLIYRNPAVNFAN